MPLPQMPGAAGSANRLATHDKRTGTWQPSHVEQHLRALMRDFEVRVFNHLRKQEDSIVQQMESVMKEQLCGISPPAVSKGVDVCRTVAAEQDPSQPVLEASAHQVPTMQTIDLQWPNDFRSNVESTVSLRSPHDQIMRKKFSRSKSELSRYKSDGGELCKAIGWTGQKSEDIHKWSKQGQSGSLLGFVPLWSCQLMLVNIAHSNAFKIVTSCLVIANSILIGVALDQDIARALNSDDKIAWESTSDLAFTVAFSIELLVRLVGEHHYFFWGPNRWWNYFDVVVVVTGILELVELLDFQLTYLRVLRVVKVVKVFRVIRVSRLFRELRMMALSIISCMVSVVWALVFLCMVIYVFALVLLEGARDYLRPEDGTEPDSEVRAAVSRWFNGVWESLFSLAQAVSGGVNWGELAVPFQKIHWSYAAGFTLFITFVMFGLLNVLVGVFVSNTSAIADIDRDFVVREEMERRSSTINQIRNLFMQLDSDNSGALTWPELRDSLDDPVVKGYFDLVEIEVSEAEGLFKLLDVDESGEVGIEEFIVGCMRLKGAAKSLDIAMVMYENKRMYRMLHTFMVEVRAEILATQQQFLQANVPQPQTREAE